MNVVLAFNALCDLFADSIRWQVYQFILLDWRIWSRCNIEIRTQHCNFILNLVKEERSMFRKKYGILYFLDVIRVHHR